MSNVVRVSVPRTGVELQLDCGMTIFVYQSEIDGVPVVEIVTEDEGNEFDVSHSEDETPDIRVMVNEEVVYGGGQ